MLFGIRLRAFAPIPDFIARARPGFGAILAHSTSVRHPTSPKQQLRWLASAPPSCPCAPSRPSAGANASPAPGPARDFNFPEPSRLVMGRSPLARVGRAAPGIQTRSGPASDTRACRGSAPERDPATAIGARPGNARVPRSNASSAPIGVTYSHPSRAGGRVTALRPGRALIG